jgi:hypothetical protein
MNESGIPSFFLFTPGPGTLYFNAHIYFTAIIPALDAAKKADTYLFMEPCPYRKRQNLLSVRTSNAKTRG